MAQHLPRILIPHHSQRPRGRLRLEAILQVVTAPERQHLHWVNFDAVARGHYPRVVEVVGSAVRNFPSPASRSMKRLICDKLRRSLGVRRSKICRQRSLRG